MAWREFECKICGHRWYPRTPERPRVCPRCKNARWDRGRARPPIAEQRAQAQARRAAEIERTVRESAVGPAVARPSARVKQVPETMYAPCGPADDFAALLREMGDGNRVVLRGELARLATPHSFVARARGLSMSNADYPDGIGPDDQVLLTPLDEYPGAIRRGAIVLAKLKYRNGAEKVTLKTFTGGNRLTAQNPRFKPIEFGPAVTEATVWAVCRGVVEKVFG